MRDRELDTPGVVSVDELGRSTGFVAVEQREFMPDLGIDRADHMRNRARVRQDYSPITSNRCPAE